MAQIAHVKAHIKVEKAEANIPFSTRGAMQANVIWQQGSSDPENTNHLATIRDWWASLSGQEVIWRPRQLVPATIAASELNWESQRFDERFVISQPELRGITLYWKKPDVAEERSTTPRKLEFDQLRQQLYVFPQSQKELVIRIGLPEIVYQKIDLNQPQWQYDSTQQTLTLKDDRQVLEVRLSLSPESWSQLKQQL